MYRPKTIDVLDTYYHDQLSLDSAQVIADGVSSLASYQLVL